MSSVWLHRSNGGALPSRKSMHTPGAITFMVAMDFQSGSGSSASR
jgi:hypothetical protein